MPKKKAPTQTQAQRNPNFQAFSLLLTRLSSITPPAASTGVVTSFSTLPLYFDSAVAVTSSKDSNAPLTVAAGQPFAAAVQALDMPLGNMRMAL